MGLVKRDTTQLINMPKNENTVNFYFFYLSSLQNTSLYNHVRNTTGI